MGTANQVWALSLHCSAASGATTSHFEKPGFGGGIWLGSRKAHLHGGCAHVIDDGLGWCWARALVCTGSCGVKWSR